MSAQKEKADDNCVRVIAKMRPFNKKEAAENQFQIVEINHQMAEVVITKPNAKDINGKALDQEVKNTFTFDAAYDQGQSQIDVFNESAKPMIDKCVEGYNATIFAYGQTGSGKTFTMMGQMQGTEIVGNKGIIPNSIDLIFDSFAHSDGDSKHLIRCSFYEIYNEQLRDMITNKDNLVLKESAQKGVYIEGLQEQNVTCLKEVLDIMDKGNKNKTVGCTLMNAGSSRSHTIFQIVLESSTNIAGKDHIKAGKLNLVDLAGSERAEKTGATGDRLKEGIQINLSLTTLAQVIEKLSSKDTKEDYVPYRYSKLTHILKDSLGGNAKTLMIINLSPASGNYDETKSTLYFGSRAKKIQNKARINEDPKDSQIRELNEQIKQLEAQLKQYGGVMTDQQVQDKQAIEDKIAIVQSVQVKKVKVQKKVEKHADEIKLAEQANKDLDSELEKRNKDAEQQQQMKQQLQQELDKQKKIFDDIKNQKDVEKDAAELERQDRLLQQQLNEQKLGETLARREQKKQEDKHNEDKEQYATVQEEIDDLKKRLETLKQNELEQVNNYQDELKQNAKDIEIRQTGLTDMNHMNTKLDLIMTELLPKEVSDLLIKNAKYDENNHQWQINGADNSGKKKRGFI